MDIVAGSHVPDDVEAFCQAINASMSLAPLQRREALLGVPAPVGYQAVALRFAEGETPAVFIYSREGRLSAAPVATSMAVKGSSRATLGAMVAASEGVLNLIIDDRRQSDSPRFCRRP